jgi:hypothetical protein
MQFKYAPRALARLNFRKRVRPALNILELNTEQATYRTATQTDSVHIRPASILRREIREIFYASQAGQHTRVCT